MTFSRENENVLFSTFSQYGILVFAGRILRSRKNLNLSDPRMSLFTAIYCHTLVLCLGTTVFAVLIPEPFHLNYFVFRIQNMRMYKYYEFAK